MRKVHVELIVDLLIHMDDDQDIQEVLENMDYSFYADPDPAIVDWKIQDSR